MPDAEKDAHVPVLDYDPEQEMWVCADHGMPECRQGDCASLPWPSADYDGGLTEYVVGFALDAHRRVALIRKNRPEWQAGRLNGIGGHVEPGETPHRAMVREFEEETGRRIDTWSLFVTMDFPGARIYFYRARLGTAVLDGLRTTTDETVCVLPAGDLGQVGIIPNLSWLVPLAAYTADDYDPIHVRASMAEALTRVTSPATTEES